MPVLQPDSSIRLPCVTILKASAGSGKTYTLTARYAQFLLSERIGKNDLRNILAITFSNNAAREMRKSVLEWLKRLSFRDPERLAEMCAAIGDGEERTARKAGELIEEILRRYSDFQVRTIDSFLSAVFRASALDFGFGPEFEIQMDSDPLISYAFSLFLRESRERTARARLLDETVHGVLGLKASGDHFPWDPASLLLAEVKSFEATLSRLEKNPALTDRGDQMRGLEGRIVEALEETARTVDDSGLEESARSTFRDALEIARAGRFGELIGKGMKSPPVKKPKGAARDPAALASYDRIAAAWQRADSLVGEYAGEWARAVYQPYLRLREELSATIERVKRVQGAVFIGDISRTLGGYLAADIVPDIYFRIGERVYHFLIDEFQDTSPIQWRNLFPLVENSLSIGGSLFAVGDTKQAIYGFRQADYTIMKSLEAENPFPSATHDVKELATNRRSRPRVLEFASLVFRQNAAASTDYAAAARRSGLDEWTQEALEGEDPGYVEVAVLERDDDDPPERGAIHALMEDLRGRGYRWGDIAILAPRNEDVLHATSWLNEKGIPFLSFSSLDVRRRGVAGEIFALLGFLDSPPDDLSFATFLLGGIFERTLASRHGWRSMEPLHRFLFQCRTERPLYKAFQREFPELWSACFAALFRSAGYLPVYDLVSEAYAAFGVFDLAGEEEATLAKLLEGVMVFEGSGSNSLREFLGAAGGSGDGEGWAIDVPRGADSVRAMTVHKSKGLGFPVAIVLLYGEANRGFPFTVVRDGGGVELVKITKAIAGRDPALAALYEEEAEKEKVNRLNSLYVALTRAKREMYVIAVRRERDSFPFDLLPAGAFPPSPAKGKAAVDPVPAEARAALSHEARTMPPSAGGGRLSREERRRGELVHRMLALVQYAGNDLEDVLAAAGSRAALEARVAGGEPAAGASAAACARMIRGTELAAYFARRPDRAVLAEQEFCDAGGRLFRMDRVVVDPDRVTVIDFKTGPEISAEYDEDMRTYARILSEAYPGRSVDAYLAYIDRCEMRRVP